MLMVNELIGFGVVTAATPPAVVNYITSLSNSGGTSTFTNASIGTASSDRYVVAIAGTYNNGSDFTTSGMTFGGNAGTEIVKSATGSIGDGTCVAGMYGLAIPSGTTSTIVVSWGGSASNGVVLHIFTITGLLSTTAVATSNAHSAGASSSALNLNLNVNNNGLVIAGYFDVTATLGSWTGVTASGNNTTQTVKGYAAAASSLSAASPRTVTATPSGSNRVCGLAASFA
jgi:hypothetical protein